MATCILSHVLGFGSPLHVVGSPLDTTLSMSASYTAAPLLQQCLVAYALERPDITLTEVYGFSTPMQQKLFSGAVDFVVVNTGGALTPQLAVQYPDVIQVPLFAQPTVIVYRINGVAKTTTLTLSLLVLSRIFSANITRWDDPQIVALNPAIPLPAAPIQVLLGERYTLTGQDALCNVFNRIDPMFSIRFPCTAATYRPPSSYALPAIICGNGILLQNTFAVTPNAISFGGLAQMIAGGLTYANIINTAGARVAPSLVTVTLPMLEAGEKTSREGKRGKSHEEGEAYHMMHISCSRS
jgi:phosphate transport system substrate-binding protein